jgi:outer membrane assembly lipoprotein YfiO
MPAGSNIVIRHPFIFEAIGLMKPKICFLLLCFIFLSAWGCQHKSAKLQKSMVPPDKTLFETGNDYLKKSQYTKARLSFQTLISTYPDSEMAAEAKFAIGDSFYDEGGTENLLQAEEYYKDFIVFWPTHPKAPDAQMKIISGLMKMIRTPDRDQSNTLKAEQEILKLIDQFPDSDYAVIGRQQLLPEVREVLALKDYGIAQYYSNRQNFPGARARLEEIIEKYPEFSRKDEVLMLLAKNQEKSNNPDEAAINYGKIVSGYSFGKYAEDAKNRLIALGKPVPVVDRDLTAMNQSHVKPSRGFSPLNPLVDFAKSLGFVPLPDRYKLAKQAREEKERIEAAEIKRKENQTADDIQIEGEITKPGPDSSPKKENPEPEKK